MIQVIIGLIVFFFILGLLSELWNKIKNFFGMDNDEQTVNHQKPQKLKKARKPKQTRQISTPATTNNRQNTITQPQNTISHDNFNQKIEVNQHSEQGIGLLNNVANTIQNVEETQLQLTEQRKVIKLLYRTTPIILTFL